MDEWARGTNNGASSEVLRNFISSVHLVWRHTDAYRAEAAAPPEILHTYSQIRFFESVI